MEAQQARIIDGKAVAEQLRLELKEEIIAHQNAKSTDSKPKLVVIIVGSRPDSQTYVRMKGKACTEAGITSVIRELPETVTQEELLGHVREFNDTADVHGILVQLPLPAHIQEREVIAAISPAKDVDGLHPTNMGRLFLKGFEPDFVPCTPKGCMELLKAYSVPVAGANAVVLGRSNIVGLPIAALLRKADATVTVCHSQTRDIAAFTRNADIVIAAIGKAKFLTREMVKPGCVIIDVGINSIPNPANPSKTKLVGDVDFEGCKTVAGALTPVPGGVGPMTIAMLLRNTVESWKRTLA